MKVCPDFYMSDLHIIEQCDECRKLNHYKPIKLYLVWALDKETNDKYLCDIFTTIKKAEHLANERNNDADRLYCDNCSVEEWEIQE